MSTFACARARRASRSVAKPLIRLCRRLPSAHREVDPKEPGLSSPSYVLGHAPTLPVSTGHAPRRLCVQSVSTTVPGGGDTNPDWLAPTALTSTFFRCRRGDLNPHGIAPTSTSSWFRLLPHVHGFAFAQVRVYVWCHGLTPRDTLCRVAIARYCTPDPGVRVRFTA